MVVVPHYIDHEQAVGCVGPVLIRVITSAPTEIVDFERCTRVVDDILLRAPAAGIWVVVHHGAPIPDSSTRRYMGQKLKGYGERVSVAFSLLGLGFWTSGAIAATVAINKVFGVNSPITTSVEAGAERLCMDLIGLNPERLVAGHATLLERIAEHGAA